MRYLKDNNLLQVVDIIIDFFLIISIWKDIITFFVLQILKVNGSNFEHSMTLEKAILSFKSSAFLEIVVKSNLLGKKFDKKEIKFFLNNLPPPHWN